MCQKELQQELPGVNNLPRRITARNIRRQESAEKNISMKKPMVSRICQEEYQQEETNGVKNPPRRNTVRRNQITTRIHREETQQEETKWRQESTEKKHSKKKTNGVKNLPRRHRRKKWRQDTRQEET